MNIHRHSTLFGICLRRQPGPSGVRPCLRGLLRIIQNSTTKNKFVIFTVAKVYSQNVSKEVRSIFLFAERLKVEGGSRNAGGDYSQVRAIFFRASTKNSEERALRFPKASLCQQSKGTNLPISNSSALFFTHEDGPSEATYVEPGPIRMARGKPTSTSKVFSRLTSSAMLATTVPMNGLFLSDLFYSFEKPEYFCIEKKKTPLSKKLDVFHQCSRDGLRESTRSQGLFYRSRYDHRLLPRWLKETRTSICRRKT